MRLSVIILNYRTPELVIDCLSSLADTIDPLSNDVLVVDNHSPDDSVQKIAAAIADKNWSSWAEVQDSGDNNGFSAGLNFGMQQRPDADAWLLTNSDILFRSDSLENIHRAYSEFPEAGLITPRLEWPDGTPQISCFRYINPVSEMLRAARTSVLDKLFKNFIPAIDISEAASRPAWSSFACILLRKECQKQVGAMDEGYFMYFEDGDYCRRARQHGWDIVNDPRAHVVHLRGGSSSVKEDTINRKQRPAYYYAARSRYFAKFYGGSAGLILTNVLWMNGRLVSLLREKLGKKAPHLCEHEEQDVWKNWLDPMNPEKRGKP